MIPFIMPGTSYDATHSFTNYMAWDRDASYGVTTANPLAKT